MTKNAPPQFDDSLMMDLRTAVVGMLGQHKIKTDTAHLTSGLPMVQGDLNVELLERALSRYQFQPVQSNVKIKRITQFPTCVQTLSKKYVVILGRDKDDFWLLHPDTVDAVQKVPLTSLVPQLGGIKFHVLPTLELLNERHVDQTLKGHWFWSRLFAQKRFLFDILSASLVANVLAVMTSLFALQVYDRVIPGEAEATLWVLASGVGLAILFEAILRLGRARLIDVLGKRSEIDITSDLFLRVLRMKLDKRPSSPGEIVHLVREFSSVKEFFTTAAVGVVADLPFVFVFLALIYAIAGNIVLVIMAGAVLIFIPSLLLQGKMARLAKENQGGAAAASRLLTEASYGLESVKINRSESYFQKQWEEIIALNAFKTTEQRALGSFLTFWASAVQQATYVIAVMFGVYMVFENELTMGAMIAIGILSTRTLSPITQLSQITSRWQNMKSALNGLEQVMAAQLDGDPTTSKKRARRPRLLGAYRFQNVQYTHEKTQNVALKIGSLKIEQGDRIALMGPNGSGKSTLLRLASALYEPHMGEILMDGLDLRQIDEHDLRANIGFLPQEIKMFRGSLRDNLLHSDRMISDEILFEALEFAGLGHFVKQHAQGLDLQILDGGHGLSMGQRQCIGIARLYIQDPSVILMDEPTSALDQSLESALVKRLGEWVGTRTCIVATHRPSILSELDKIVVLNKGEVIISGKRDEVIAKLKSSNSTSQPIGTVA